MAKQAKKPTSPKERQTGFDGSRTMAREREGSVARDKGIDRTALAARIPGWGSDLERSKRPAVPMEKAPPHGTGAHWQHPPQQKTHLKILKSIEHADMTPVFGTTCPPRGLSGALRKFAYRYSEGRMAHWLLLMAADRVDVAEGLLSDLVHFRFVNPLKEVGLAAEWKRLAFGSPRQRATARRWGSRLLVVAGAAGIAWLGLRRFRS